MRKIIPLLVIMLFITYLSFSQETPAKTYSENDIQMFVSGRPSVITNMDALYEGVHGTPYFSEKWLIGDIYLTDNSQIKQVSLRYNIYKDELEYMNKTSGKSFIIQRNKIKGFLLQAEDSIRTFESIKFKAGKPEENFTEVLYGGNINLLLQYKKIFTPANYKGAYSTGNKYDEYKDDQEYYLINSKGEVSKIKLSKKSITSALEEKEAEIQQYISSHSIDFSKLKDVLQLLTYVYQSN